MTLDEYQKAAARTAPMTVTAMVQQATFSLGLVCEATEVLEVMGGENVDPELFIKELGDVLWYTAGLCTLFKLSLADTATLEHKTNPNAQELVIKAGKVSDYMKKVIGHGHDMDTARLSDEIGGVLQAIHSLCLAYGISLSDVGKANVAKLKARYPDGFSSEASRNRTA